MKSLKWEKKNENEMKVERRALKKCWNMCSTYRNYLLNVLLSSNTFYSNMNWWNISGIFSFSCSKNFDQRCSWKERRKFCKTSSINFSSFFEYPRGFMIVLRLEVNFVIVWICNLHQLGISFENFFSPKTHFKSKPDLNFKIYFHIFFEAKDKKAKDDHYCII